MQSIALKRTKNGIIKAYRIAKCQIKKEKCLVKLMTVSSEAIHIIRILYAYFYEKYPLKNKFKGKKLAPVSA